MRTQRALRACAEWLAYCLSIGWKRSDIDALEALWWRYHDDYGRLIKRPDRAWLLAQD